MLLFDEEESRAATSALESYFAVAGGNRTKVCGPCASRAATRASFVRFARHL